MPTLSKNKTKVELHFYFKFETSDRRSPKRAWFLDIR
mgnify:FL=1